MNIIEATRLSRLQKEQIRSLWNREYPGDIMLESPAALEAYLSKLEDHRHLLLCDTDENIRGWYFDFIRDNTRNFAMIIDHSLQGRGYGRRLLNKGRSGLRSLQGWVVTASDYLKANGQVYRSPLGFYLKNGFRLCEGETQETKALKTVKIRWSQPARRAAERSL